VRLRPRRVHRVCLVTEQDAVLGGQGRQSDVVLQVGGSDGAVVGRGRDVQRERQRRDVSAEEAHADCLLRLS
jgi:hypothetical protein